MGTWKYPALPAALWLLISLSLLGCEGDEGPAGPPGTPTIYISGKVAAEPSMWPYGPPPYPTWATLQVSDLPSIPEVAVNGTALPINYVTGDQISFLEFDLPVEPGDSVHLSVNYVDADSNPRQAWADILLPEAFSIILPDTAWNLQIPWAEDLELHWEASGGADAYWFYFNLYASYWVAGEHQSSFCWLDTTIADTHLTIPLTLYLPDTSLMDSADGGMGELKIVAQNGIWQEGELGNIQGDGDGFFYARTQESAEIELLPPAYLANPNARGSK